MTILSQLQQSSSLPNQAIIMAIMNVTPDSFSDGGLLYKDEAFTSAILDRAKTLVAEGAHILDIGGESTRPGATPVSLEEELARVIPAIEAIRKTLDTPISIDTSRPEVMEAAIKAGADIINDVRALSLDKAVEMAVKLDVPVCLMHMKGTPATMQQQPSYDDVVIDVTSYLYDRANIYIAAGGKAEHIIFDPGFGFGKTLEHNVALFKALPKLVEDNKPWLVGVSRKSMLGALTGKDTGERVTSSAVAAAIAIKNGAQIVRVHDVAATVDALKIIDSLSEQ